MAAGHTESSPYTYSPRFSRFSTSLLLRPRPRRPRRRAQVALSFRARYKETNGLEVRDAGKIRRRYLCSTFAVDALAALPVEAAILATGPSKRFDADRAGT